MIISFCRFCGTPFNARDSRAKRCSDESCAVKRRRELQSIYARSLKGMAARRERRRRMLASPAAREKERERKRKYRMIYRQKILERGRAYRAANLERRNACDREYRRKTRLAYRALKELGIEI